MSVAVIGASPDPLTPQPRKEGAIRKFTVNLLGVAALAAAGVVLLRQGPSRSDSVEAKIDEQAPPGETIPGKVRLEKLRELGI